MVWLHVDRVGVRVESEAVLEGLGTRSVRRSACAPNWNATTCSASSSRSSGGISPGSPGLRTATHVPIMLDESLMSLADMVAAIRHGAADYVLLKLDNYGGTHPSRQVATVARAGGVVPIPGGSAHTGIGAASLAHLAVALDLMP